MARLTPAQMRKKHDATFQQFWAAYPRHTHINQAVDEWGKLIEQGGDPARIIGAARRYSASVAGKDMTYVPGPQNWLKAGQYEDADLFQDEQQAQKTWLQQMWKTANVRAVQDRYHVTMPKHYPPDDVVDPDAIRFWYKQKAREWIASVAEVVGVKGKSADSTGAIGPTELTDSAASMMPEPSGALF